MTIKTYSTIIILLFLGISHASKGQDFQFTVKGNVVDILNGKSIENAKISIVDLKNDSIIDMFQTGANGKFELNFDKGNYQISFSAENYRTLLEPLKYSEFKNKKLKLENFPLEPIKFTELEEVTVTAKNFSVKTERGKKIYRIGNKLKDAAGTMSNLLSYIPSVFVDIDGKMQLRGREPIIKINGRRSSLSKAEALKMLPSDMVKEIEIIRNPADRDGEMEPVINIITDKSRREMIGGVNAAAGLPTTLKGGLHLAVNKEKFNGYGLYGIKKQIDIETTNQTFLERPEDNLNYREEENSKNELNQTNHFGELQFEYLPNENSELVGNVSVYSDKTNLDYTGVRSIKQNSVALEKIDQISQNNNDNFSIVSNVEYELKLNEGQDFLKAEVEYEYEKKQKSENFSEAKRNENQNFQSYSDDDLEGNDLELQFRYDKMLNSNAYLTMGYRFDRSSIDQNQYFESDELDSDFLQNNINYAQYDNLGFIDFSSTFKDLYYSVGFQLKNTNRILKDLDNNEKSEQDFFNILPRLFMTYQFENENEINFNYYSFLGQPRLNYLNSFNTSTDLQNIRIGNPALKPQFTHRLELEHLKDFENSSISTTLYTSFTKDIIQYLSRFDDASNRTISQPENIGEAKTFGIDFSYSLNSPSWLNSIIKVNGEYGTISNAALNSENFYAVNTSIINVARLKSYRVEFSWFYSPPQKINYQIREASNQYFKFGLSRRILNNKGNLVLSVIDPFNTGRRIQKINTDEFDYRNEYNPNQRRIFLSIFYRFSTKSKFRETDKEAKEKGIFQ